MKNFTYDARKGGVFCSTQKLMPHPGKIFRRQAVLDVVSKLYAKQTKDHDKCLNGLKYLEIGCGTGIFAYEFYRLGADVHIYDLSENALEIANSIFNTDKTRLTIKHSLDDSDKGLYDIVAAYEVLEHVEKDAEMLKYWMSFLKEEGTLFLSVPARMKYWSFMDKAAGHFRRYEKKELENLLVKMSHPPDIISLGVPFQLVIMKLANIFVWKKESRLLENLSNQQKTEMSGMVTKIYKYNKVLPYRLLVFMAKVQRLFYKTDLGFNYLVTVKKRI